ncbi:MAG: aminotransferase class V-fold PLP-dependent enzyme [Pirellulales bacterium]|nr:aminotransferase class V-fold PLP-dependent enzyme [Pirellulales bacterium]
MLDAKSRLRDFPNLAVLTYLNTAAEGIPPRAVSEALAQYSRDKLLGMDGRTLHEAQWQLAREQVAKAFGLTADEIGICSCSSDAFNLAALALRLRDGDEVIINDLDFPAGATPWLQSTCPATAKLWKSHQGALRTSDLKALLSSRTRLVSTSLVSFYNGFRLPLEETIATVRRHSDALIALDVTQALGRITLDLRDVDLIVSSTHKWILASHGGGLVGVPHARAEQWTVPAGGWFNRQDAFGADRFERTTPKSGAASFCVGMPNYPATYAIATALEYLQSVGIAAIEAHADPLVRQCFDAIKTLPVELLTPDEFGAIAGIIAFRHPQAARIYEHLHARNIHVMHHAGRLRVSLHGYNTQSDLDRFLAALREALHEC